jgi:hypothetical protein
MTNMLVKSAYSKVDRLPSFQYSIQVLRIHVCVTELYLQEESGIEQGCLILLHDPYNIKKLIV